MNMFPRLWQRIFLYSLMLVVLSLGMGVGLHHLDFLHQRGTLVSSFSREILTSLNGQDLHVAATVLGIFNKRHSKLWLEDADGNLVLGQRFDGLEGDTWRTRLHGKRRVDGITLWKTYTASAEMVAEAPLVLEGRPFRFYMAVAGPPRPPLRTFVAQWFFTMLFIGGLMSLWMARRVSRPLGNLEKELADRHKTKLLADVTVSGNDEIAAVATAINQLMDSLRRHITGMRELVANISHELRSPLARMTVSADLIGQGLFPAALPEGGTGAEAESQQRNASVALAQKHFASLLEELEYMDKLIGATLLSSKLDLRSPGSFTEELDYSALCRNASLRHEPLFHQAQCGFAHEITPGLRVAGDVTLLQQLIFNLLDNALKYASPPAPEVRLKLERRRNSVFLTVENPSPPMPEDIQERIFEPFFRHEQSTGTGAGLGLWLVRKIAVLHGGEAMAVSTERGLCLCVQIPLQERNRVPVAIPQQTAEPSA